MENKEGEISPSLCRVSTIVIVEQRVKNRLCRFPRGVRTWGRIVREFGSNLYTLLCLKWITNKVLLYTPKGILLKVIWQFRWIGGLEENGYMYMYD